MLPFFSAPPEKEGQYLDDEFRGHNVMCVCCLKKAPSAIADARGE